MAISLLLMVPLLCPSSFLTPSLPAPVVPRKSHFTRFRIPLRRPHSSIYSISNSASGCERYKQQVYGQNQQLQPRTLYPWWIQRTEIKVPGLVLQLDPDEVLSGERVDIASAAGASEVLLSDQGLPTIIARNTMLDSKSESVVLPLVARIVQTVDAAVDASKSEGADFLIYGSDNVTHVNLEVRSVCENVKIPIFVMHTSNGKNISYAQTSNLLSSGASSFVMTLKSFGLFGDDVLHKLFDTGYIKLEDREKQLIDTEKSVLAELIKVIMKAAPLMEEVSLLDDAVSQIDDPFLLVIVFLGMVGGLSVAGLSASLLTSVLPTTLEYLLALGLCSADGYLAILNFPTQRQRVIDKVKRTADASAHEPEEGMKKDFVEAVRNLDTAVKLLRKPYLDQAQNRRDKLLELEIQEELSNVEEKLRTLQIEIQNLHAS